MMQELQRPVWAAWWADGRPGAMTPETYGQAMLDWVEQQAHSGPEPKEKYAEYTRLNAARARRVAKTYRMSEDMATILDSGRTEGQHWVVITESWCGDAVQCLPLIRMWAERAEVPLEVMLRDTGVPLIDDFRTRGGRSIPMWVVAETSGAVLGQWGPRPETARRMVLEHKEALEPKPPYAEFASQVQLWYARDRGREIEREAREMLTAIGRDATLHS